MKVPTCSPQDAGHEAHEVFQPKSRMRSMKTKTLILSAVAAAAIASPVLAQTNVPWEAPKKGDFLVTARLTNVSSSADNAITTAAGEDSGLRVDVADSTMPTLGFTYFLTDKFAVEGILGTTHHDIRAKGPDTDVLVHETWVLPPVVTLQYRPIQEGRFSPYVGAGVSYMAFYSGDDQNGFKVKLKDGFGTALQAGADIGIHGPWSVNVDVKKVFFDTKANINDGALKSDVELNPWVVSVGVSRRF